MQDDLNSEDWQKLFALLNPEQQNLYQQALSYEHASQSSADQLFKAFNLHQQLAEQHCVLSIYWLGNCYLEFKFAYLYQASFPTLSDILLALQESALIDDNLSYKHVLQKIFDSNLYYAEKYLTIAAEYNYPEAWYNLGLLYIKDKFKHKNLTKAKHFFELAVQKNHPWAKYYLAVMLESEKKLEQSLDLYKQAAEQDCHFALFTLGIKYSIGQEVQQDKTLSTELITKAAKLGNPMAQFLYSNALLENHQDTESLDYCLKSAQGNYIGAQFALGDKYLLGAGGATENLTKALHWYTRSAVNGNTDSLYCLGVMHEYGMGTKINPEKAIDLYIKAASAGVEGAKKKLGFEFKPPEKPDLPSFSKHKQQTTSPDYIQAQLEFIKCSDPKQARKNTLAHFILK